MFHLKLQQTSITKPWREIFAPAAQIFLNSNVMCRKEKIKKHLFDIDNAIIYSLFLVLFLYELYYEGWIHAIWSIATLLFLASGWFSVAYIVGSARAKNFSMDLSDKISLVYFLSFSLYWILEQGISRKLFFLALPVLTGMILVGAGLFIKTDAYKRLDKWENGFYKKIFSVFRKKT